MWSFSQETGGTARRRLLKRDSFPALLTALYGFYKRAVEDSEKEHPLVADDVGKLQKLAQTLAKMREEVYEQEYLGTLQFSMFEYEGPDDYPRMQRRIRGLAMFWFGWWQQHKDETPQGEPNVPGRRRNRKK